MCEPVLCVGMRAGQKVKFGLFHLTYGGTWLLIHTCKNSHTENMRVLANLFQLIQIVYWSIYDTIRPITIYK